MNFKNNNDGTATILCYGEIGIEVIGSEVAQSILMCQQLGFQKINVRINSGGGSVEDGYSIFSAILNSKIPVDTYVDGLAASIAGVIAMAGQKIYCADFGIVMLHNPSMEIQNEKDKEVLQKIKESLIQIFNSRTGIDKSKIDDLMNKETWMNAKEALKGGFIDEIYTTNKKVKLNPKNMDAKRLYNICNKIITENKMMEKIYNSLSLTETDFNEETVLSKIEDMKNSLATLKNENETLTKDKDDIQNMTLSTIDDLKKQIDDLLKKVDEMKTEKEDTVINHFLETSVKEGKIAEEEKTEYFNLAKFNFDSVKNLITKRPINKKTIQVEEKVKRISNQVQAGRENWTIRDYELKDPKELKRIKDETPEIFQHMFDKFYNK